MTPLDPVDLRTRLDAALSDEPPGRLAEENLAAGKRLLRRRRMTWAAALGTFTVALGVPTLLFSLGDTADDRNSASADCSNQVRLHNRVYTSHGYTDRVATRFALAELAECHDVAGEGSVFPEDPQYVGAWSFPGYPTDQVLGVRFDEDSFAVYVADGVPRAESERIFRELDSEAVPITNREIGLAEALVRQELRQSRHADSTVESASVTVDQGRVKQSNTGHACESGRLLRIRLLGTFPRIVTSGHKGASAEDTVVGAVLLTADAESGHVCLIGVRTGQVQPAPGATTLNIP